MAPPKKPAERRVRSQTKDLGLVSAGPVLAPPPAPKQSSGKAMKAETVEAWKAYWSSDLAALAKPSDHPALVRLFRMYDLRARLEQIAVANPMVEGSMGQHRANPVLSDIASLDTRILALEDRFGLSPAARLKLGVSFGAAARSLEELNREFNSDDEEDPEEDFSHDPRIRVIDTTAS